MSPVVRQTLAGICVGLILLPVVVWLLYRYVMSREWR